MITLITGGTGDGKTALAVKLMLTEYAGRPIYCMGIPELTIDHNPTPPVDQWTEMRTAPEDPTLELAYFTFPENSVIFLDEGQRVFRPRHPSAKVPPEVQAFETHRHCGIDWVIITQFPQLLDANIRRLVKRHIHIHATALGKFRLEWPTIGDPEEKSSREIAAKSRYSPPKEVFGLYKSAEVHTKLSRRIPWYVYGFFAAALLTAVLAFRGYQVISEKLQPTTSTPGVDAIIKGKVDSEQAPAKATKASWIADRNPRLQGQAWTAPVYDEITKPIDAPFPQVCVEVKPWRGNPAKCRCLDQQGNNYAATDSLCRHIAKNGIFKDWGQATKQDGQSQTGRPASESPPQLAGDQVSRTPG